MKKAIFAQPFQVEHIEAEIPSIKSNQVLIKVINVGICGSDMHTYHGKHPTRNQYPLEFGHEMSGIILRVGDDVTDYHVGERVTVEPQQYCGKCAFCQKGYINVCKQAKGSSVFMTEYVAIDSYMLHHCPADMPFDQIALVEPVAVAVASVKHCNYQGAKICVVGGGTIGNLIAQVACQFGAADVMVTDFVEEKIAYARKAGIPHCVNTSNMRLKDAIEKCFGEDGADVIIDAAASVKGFEQILDASRVHSQIVITGSYSQPVEFALTRLQRREVSLIGHHMYIPEDYRQAIDLVYKKKIFTDGFISAFYPLDEVEKAFAYIDDNHGLPMKVMINIGTPELNTLDKELMTR